MNLEYIHGSVINPFSQLLSTLSPRDPAATTTPPRGVLISGNKSCRLSLMQASKST
jgi:hypothetical protein